ncbi:MAG: type VI secretion system lipoprotein TssJ [Cocleimonas sp.]|nr:type VI secretion system lipoprotein TssJ [Cocleimonas sp.]
MNTPLLRSLFIILCSSSFLMGCSKVGDLVSNTGEFVAKTGEIIGGKKKEQPPLKAPEMPKIETPKMPEVIKIQEAKAATAKVQIRTTKNLSQSRIQITVIQLKSGGKFLSSRLSDLVSDTEATLGSDFINKQSVSLKRGESKELNLEIDPSTKTLGAFASFKELNQTIWRTGVQLPKATNASYTVQINVDRKLISATKK